MPSPTRTLDGLHWPLVIGLGAVGLVRPLVSLVLDQAGTPRPALVPVLLTLAISLLWIGVVGLGRVARPVLTLTGAGVVYAVAATLLSGVLSPMLTGQLQGPLANPIGLIPLLLFNAGWGAVCGVIAAGVRHIRGRP